MIKNMIKAFDSSLGLHRDIVFAITVISILIGIVAIFYLIKIIHIELRTKNNALSTENEQ